MTHDGSVAMTKFQVLTIAGAVFAVTVIAFQQRTIGLKAVEPLATETQDAQDAAQIRTARSPENQAAATFEDGATLAERAASGGSLVEAITDIFQIDDPLKRRMLLAFGNPSSPISMKTYLHSKLLGLRQLNQMG